MADIRKILSKCNIKRFGYVHENLTSINVSKNSGTIAMTVDPETAAKLQIASLGGILRDVVILVVVDATEFNKAFEEEK